MGNFRAYPGLWLLITEEKHPLNNKGEILPKGTKVQLLNAAGGIGIPRFFTFANVNGTYEQTGKGFEPIYNDGKE